MAGDGSISQPSPAAILTPFQRLNNALQTDPRCAQEVIFPDYNQFTYYSYLHIIFQMRRTKSTFQINGEFDNIHDGIHSFLSI